MNAEIYIYRSMRFDGSIYVRIGGGPSQENYNITLFRNDKVYASSEGYVAKFHSPNSGVYHGTVTWIDQEGEHRSLESNRIYVDTMDFGALEEKSRDFKKLKVEPVRYDNINKYRLYLKLLDDESIEKLKKLPRSSAPNFYEVKEQAKYTKIGHNILLGDIMPNTYLIDPQSDFDSLVDMANELDALDYVVYCEVAPDMTDMPPPELPGQTSTPEVDSGSMLASTTPNFQPLQTYLQASEDSVKGMNVLQAWARGETGSAVTVRLIDFGVYRNHEDLAGRITVVTSRSEEDDCNHGTATTGIIVAANNGYGVTGVSYGCKFYFYDIGGLDIGRLVSDAVPGDVVSISVGTMSGGKRFPIIISRSWWDVIRALTQNGVIVAMSASNGNLDLSPSAGNLPDYGDCGGTLIGACYHHSGGRAYFSNYNHPTSLMNSWGDWSVATTGYGDLQTEPGNNRNYTASFSGTSSATPLCSGALTLIQSYAIRNFGIFLNSYEMRELLIETGYTEGVADHIGYRPNVDAALTALQNKMAPSKLTVSPDGTKVSGRGTPNCKVRVYGPDGATVIGTGNVNSAGDFIVLLNPAQLNGGVLAVVTVLPNGKESPRGYISTPLSKISSVDYLLPLWAD
jgi:subtilisin family serine protease